MSLNLTETSDIKGLHPDGQTRIKDAADILGVHHQTLRRWWKAGKFAYPTDINGILLFKNSDLINFIEGHYSSSEPVAQNKYEAKLDINPLSDRKYYAGLALQALIANPNCRDTVSQIAIEAVKHADALIEALSKIQA